MAVARKDKRTIKPVPVPLVRSIDDLGRIVIPAEIRKILKIDIGDKLNVYMTVNGIYMEVMNEQPED